MGYICLDDLPLAFLCKAVRFFDKFTLLKETTAAPKWNIGLFFTPFQQLHGYTVKRPLLTVEFLHCDIASILS